MVRRGPAKDSAIRKRFFKDIRFFKKIYEQGKYLDLLLVEKMVTVFSGFERIAN